MKKYVIFIALFCLCCGVSAQAQTPKFGHINVEELVSLMTERDSAMVKFQKFVAEYQEMFEEIQVEYRTKANEYNQKSASWSAAILEMKQNELNGIRERLEQFSQTAQQMIENQQNVLFFPVYTRANEAVKKIAKDLGLIYVFNSAAMPYIDEVQSLNLLNKAKAELKIPAGKVSPTPFGE